VITAYFNVNKLIFILEYSCQVSMRAHTNWNSIATVQVLAVFEHLVITPEH